MNNKGQLRSHSAGSPLVKGEGLGARSIDTLVRRAHQGIRRAMKRIRRPEAHVAAVSSPIGQLLVAESQRGIAAVHFLWTSGPERTLELLRRRFDLAENSAFAERIAREIEGHFHGDPALLRHPIDFSMI